MTKHTSSKQRGFTLIELMIVVAIIGILAAVAIPAFMRYIKKSKSSEAKVSVAAMYTGFKTYFENNSAFPGSAGTYGPSPALGTTCVSGVSTKLAPNAALWTATPWVDMNFEVNDAQLYMYSYTVAASSASATAIAQGDLNCNATYATFKQIGLNTAGDFVGGSLVATNPDE